MGNSYLGYRQQKIKNDIIQRYLEAVKKGKIPTPFQNTPFREFTIDNVGQLQNALGQYVYDTVISHLDAYVIENRLHFEKDVTLAEVINKI